MWWRYPRKPPQETTAMTMRRISNMPRPERSFCARTFAASDSSSYASCRVFRSTSFSMSSGSAATGRGAKHRSSTSILVT